MALTMVVHKMAWSAAALQGTQGRASSSGAVIGTRRKGRSKSRKSMEARVGSPVSSWYARGLLGLTADVSIPYPDEKPTEGPSYEM